MLKRYLAAVIIVFMLAAAAMTYGTALQLNDPLAQHAAIVRPQASRVLFLEHYLVANGTVVKGEAPFRSVNFPTYWFNENTRQLNGNIGFPINNTLAMIFGDVLTLTGDFGAGTGNKLYGIYSLPAIVNKDVIYSTDLYGNVIMRVNKKILILKPGESYTYSNNETLSDNNAQINVVYNQTYVNHGFIDESRIGTSLVTH